MLSAANSQRLIPCVAMTCAILVFPVQPGVTPACTPDRVGRVAEGGCRAPGREHDDSIIPEQVATSEHHPTAPAAPAKPYPGFPLFPQEVARTSESAVTGTPGWSRSGSRLRPARTARRLDG